MTLRVRAKLNKTSKQLKAAIRDDKRLWDSLEDYLTNNELKGAEDMLDPKVTAYLLVAWILESDLVNLFRTLQLSGFFHIDQLLFLKIIGADIPQG